MTTNGNSKRARIQSSADAAESSGTVEPLHCGSAWLTPHDGRLHLAAASLQRGRAHIHREPYEGTLSVVLAVRARYDDPQCWIVIDPSRDHEAVPRSRDVDPMDLYLMPADGCLPNNADGLGPMPVDVWEGGADLLLHAFDAAHAASASILGCNGSAVQPLREGRVWVTPHDGRLQQASAPLQRGRAYIHREPTSGVVSVVLAARARYRDPLLWLVVRPRLLRASEHIVEHHEARVEHLYEIPAGGFHMSHSPGRIGRLHWEIRGRMLLRAFDTACTASVAVFHVDESSGDDESSEDQESDSARTEDPAA